MKQYPGWLHEMHRSAPASDWLRTRQDRNAVLTVCSRIMFGRENKTVDCLQIV